MTQTADENIAYSIINAFNKTLVDKLLHKSAENFKKELRPLAEAFVHDLQATLQSERSAYDYKTVVNLILQEPSEQLRK